MPNDTHTFMLAYNHYSNAYSPMVPQDNFMTTRGFLYEAN